ncbi:MAG: transketolase [Rhodospirillaceae bacterium]|nr:transketolase [Rhodospirillaceae bacterium]MBT4486375.1 transketolase [Rhodospirillaceae bacterium]MBT5191386.1 transketolase [Rhodospirillaceae bacterium]MBT5896399.1 transketolase [Rhodospirillaceae bacterium]MBT6426099.1 transketolase [Rhodospirillaceae bacterium]
MDRRSRDLRKLVVRGLVGGGRGHLGSALSAVEIVRVLYDDIMAHDAARPNWEARDRFLLSKGHGCLAQYAVLADEGYFPKAELDRFCRFDGILGGHPDAGKVPGVEASTGALGHGPSIAVGMAVAAKLKGSAHRVFCVTGDGEINEGAVWEAAMAAGKHQLDNLTIIVDYNKLQSYDRTEVVQDLEPLTSKWESFGFAVRNVDGHDVEALRRTFSTLPFATGRPNAVIAHTIKSRGVAHAEGDPSWHHKSKMTDEEIAGVLAAIEG